MHGVPHSITPPYPTQELEPTSSRDTDGIWSAHLRNDPSVADFNSDLDLHLDLNGVVSDEPEHMGYVGQESIDQQSIDPISNDNKLTALTSAEVKSKHKLVVSARIFMATSVISALLIILFESYLFAIVNIHKNEFSVGTDSRYSYVKYTEISIYLALFVFAAFYQVLLTYVGLRTKNILLLSMLLIFYACMLVYTGIQYSEISVTIQQVLTGSYKTATKATNLATIGVLGATLIIQLALLLFRLRKRLDFARYYKIGANDRIRKMYNVFQIHRSLIIFDFFFFVGFTIQYLVIMVNNRTNYQFILTICMIPVGIFILFLSDFATTREVRILTIFTAICLVGGSTYILYKLVLLYTKYSTAYNAYVAPGQYFPGRTSLTVFGILTLILLFATVVLEGFSFRNYGKGLLPKVSTYYRYLPGYNQGAKDTHKNEKKLRSSDEKATNDNGSDEVYMDSHSDDDDVSIN
ncbi:uncharacterized protein RJT21DRAFT_40621 [Scheffersomyces amazonensis]|uniref:uncharacterized protein n=1 Tax=Scheffersomyces amazonensis TaxID=1078765 RepID=UPI00315D3E3B